MRRTKSMQTKKAYEDARMRVIRLSSADILTASPSEEPPTGDPTDWDIFGQQRMEDELI